VEHCLGYVHGDKIDLPVSELKSSLEKLFIIANYLQVYPLVHQVRLFATQSRIVMDFDGMGRFIQTLPEMTFMDDFPINMRQLPSQNAEIPNFEDANGQNSVISPNIHRVEPLHSNMVGPDRFNKKSNGMPYVNASDRYRKRPHGLGNQNSNNVDNKWIRPDNTFKGGGLINEPPTQMFIPPEDEFQEPLPNHTSSTQHNAHSSNSFNFPNPYNR